MQQDPIPDAPTWPWIVGGILIALSALVAALKKLWTKGETSQDSLVAALHKDIERREKADERRDKADERRDDEMKAIILSHEKIVESHDRATESSKHLMTSLADTLRKAIDDQGKRQERVLNRIAERLDRDRHEPPGRDS